MAELHACTGKCITTYPLVLLHGWGFDSGVWQTILPALQEFFDVITLDLPGFAKSNAANIDIDTSDINIVSAQLLKELPEKSIFLGWSLGGMIATHIAMHFPQRVMALITVGSNLKWVKDAEHDWPGALPDNFASFFQNLSEQSESTKNHFCAVIARGDHREKTLVKLLRKQLSEVPTENFLHGLNLLDSIDNREGFKRLAVPGLHLFGEQDTLVPSAVEAAMHTLNHKQQTFIFSGLSHAPFLSEPELFVATVKTFIQALSYQVNKQRVAESFSKAAPHYDAAADLQREIGDQLFAKLTTIKKHQPKIVLDLGCGTGAYSQKLAQQFPSAQIIGLDIASGMLQVAKDKNPLLSGVCADAEALPFKDRSIDLIFSNLAIQWCQCYEQLFSELQRVLISGGLCFISTFQQGTLRELKTAWQAVDDCVHVNEFSYTEKLREMTLEAGLSSIDVQHQSLVKYYAGVKQLTQELKDIGAHNMNHGRPSGLTGKRKLHQLLEAYEKFRINDQLPAHYEIIYLTFAKE